MSHKYAKVALALGGLVIVTSITFYAAAFIQSSEIWQAHLRDLSILGIIGIGLICGLNALVPIPAATFAPLFLEAGVAPYLVVAGLVIGTTMADSIGYLLGYIGRGYMKDNHPGWTAYFQKIFHRHQATIPFITFVFFAIAPLPNETILIPLALTGYRYDKLILPLILGNIIHQTLLVFGYSQAFSFFT